MPYPITCFRNVAKKVSFLRNEGVNKFRLQIENQTGICMTLYLQNSCEFVEKQVVVKDYRLLR